MANIQFTTNGRGVDFAEVSIKDLQYTPSSYDYIEIFITLNGTVLDSQEVYTGGGSSGSYYTSGVKFTGLTPETQYGFYALARKNAGGTDVRIPTSGYTYGTTLSAPVPGDVSISLVSVSGLSYTLSITTGADTTSVEIYRSYNTTNYTVTIGSNTTTTVTLNASEYDSTFTVRARGLNQYTSGSWSSYLTITSGSSLSNSYLDFTSNGITYNSMSVSVKGLAYAPSAYNYIGITNNNTGETKEVYTGGGSSGSYYTSGVTFSGLTPETEYNFYAYAQKNSGGTRVRIPSSGYLTGTTSSAPVPASATIYVSSIDGLNITFRVSAGENTESVRIDASWLTSYYDVTLSSGNYTFVTLTVPEYSTEYSVRIRGVNSYTLGSWSDYNTFTSGEAPTPAIPTISNVSVFSKTITLTVTAGANTTGVEIEQSWGGTTDVAVSSNSSVTFTLEVPSFETTYTIRARAYNEGAFGSYSSYTSFTTGEDDIPPTLTIDSINRYNGITVSWTASDEDSGLKTVDTYIVYIRSNINTNTWTTRAVLTAETTQYTISQDAEGAPLVSNVSYTFRVRAYDNKNNTTYIDNSVVVLRTRPSNFAWTVAKVSGGTNTILSTEWNSLLERINAFRLYKGLAYIYTFIEAVKGNDFTATMFNQAVNIINTMSPPTSPPTTKSAGQVVYASDLNLLRDSLNSIT